MDIIAGPAPSSFDDLDMGKELETAPRTTTEEDVKDFVRLTGDYTEHVGERDGGHAEPARPVIVHGALVLSIAVGMVSRTGLFHRRVVGFLETNARYRMAIQANDTIRATVRILSKRTMCTTSA